MGDPDLIMVLIQLQPLFWLLLILLFVLIGKWRKRREARRWQPVDVRVLRMEAVEERIDQDTLGERSCRLEIAFSWEGQTRQRTWMFPRTYDLPKEGEVLHMLYDPAGNQLRLAPDPEFEARVSRLRRRLLLTLLGGLAVLLGAGSLTWEIPFVWPALSVAVVLIPLWLWRQKWSRIRRRQRQRFKNGEFRPVTAVVQGYRQDYEGDRFPYCLVTVSGEEREITLPIRASDSYTVGQQVTLYWDPESGHVGLPPE